MLEGEDVVQKTISNRALARSDIISLKHIGRRWQRKNGLVDADEAQFVENKIMIRLNGGSYESFSLQKSNCDYITRGLYVLEEAVWIKLQVSISQKCRIN